MAETFTEAQANAGILLVRIDSSGRSTNYRTVPYAEEYRARSGVSQTPVERIQEAARDEEKRRALL
jgi:hypothetical protein